MSEYQYYEFQAIDRPLTEEEQREVRSVSTRAAITATRFTNHYEWGNFKGNPAVWVEKYFDAFLYLANWGTHELMLRLPRRVLDLKTAKRYCRGRAAAARSHGDFVILEISSEEEGGDWEDDGRESHPSLPPQDGEAPRTVGELREAAEQRAKERRRKEAERAAAERAQREREAAEARERHLAALAKREAEAWREVDALVATKQPNNYDAAVKLLCDLRELGVQKGRAGEVEARILRLREEHGKKPSFLRRLEKAGL